MIVKGLDWTDDGCSASAKSLIHAPFFDCFYHFLYFELSNCDLELTEFLHKLNETHPGDSRQYRAVEWRGYQLIFALFILPEHEKVHGTDFGYVVVQKPQHLVTVLFFKTVALTPESRGIVSANLFVSKALRPGSNDISFAEELHGHKTTRVVRSDRT